MKISDDVLHTIFGETCCCKTFYQLALYENFEYKEEKNAYYLQVWKPLEEAKFADKRLDMTVPPDETAYADLYQYKKIRYCPFCGKRVKVARIPFR